MTTSRRLAVGLVGAVLAGAVVAPAAAAQPLRDTVTYEVVSTANLPVDIEYQDVAGRTTVGTVALPWRIDATVDDVFGPPPRGSQVRADWRGRAWPGTWVTVRIIHRGTVICQSTMDVGNSTCYGVTPRIG